MDNALKKPLQQSIRNFTSTRSNDFQQNVAKSIPCRVTKVDKDFVTVSFEPQNKVFTLPSVKIPQSFSAYARDPTQVGDLGYAVPSDYYLGTVSGDAGGNTNFYPRGNLTALSFQPISRTANPTRDYNQYTITGGTSGVKIIQNATQSSSAPSGPGDRKALQRRLLGYGTAAKQAWLRARHPVKPELLDTSSSKGFMDINSSGDIHHRPAPSKNVYLGGDGTEGAYALVLTVSGPCINVLGRIG
jgi:hypothetical protein